MHNGFVRDIVERPWDDAPRLIYADWLEDNGEGERAEFIRAQVELGDRPCPVMTGLRGDGRPSDRRCGACGVCDLRRRELKIFEANGTAWFGPTACLTPPSERERRSGGVFRVVRRGFVEVVSCPLQVWLDHGPAVVRAAPVLGVGATDRAPQHSTYTGSFTFRRGGGNCPGDQHWLPPEVYDLLGGGELCVRWDDPERYRSYLHEETARADLSRALADWARRRARLPALRREGVTA